MCQWGFESFYYHSIAIFFFRICVTLSLTIFRKSTSSLFYLNFFFFCNLGIGNEGEGGGILLQNVRLVFCKIANVVLFEREKIVSFFFCIHYTEFRINFESLTLLLLGVNVSLLLLIIIIMIILKNV